MVILNVKSLEFQWGCGARESDSPAFDRKLMLGFPSCGSCLSMVEEVEAK